MDADQNYQSLIGELYESVLDPSKWRNALGLCGRFVGGDDTQIITIDKRTQLASTCLLAGTSFSLDGNAEYMDHYLALDPRRSLLEGGLDEWRFCHQFNDQKLVRQHEFYQEFLLPYGVRYSMAVKLEESADNYTVFGFLGRVGREPFSEDDAFKANLLTKHLKLIHKLNNHTQQLQQQALISESTLDKLTMAMFVVDHNAKIVFSNRRAESLVNNPCNDLNTFKCSLSIKSAKYADQMKRMIKNSTSSPGFGGAMTIPGKSSLQLYVSPIPASSHYANYCAIPLALVIVIEPQQPVSQLDIFAGLYGLTLAEIKLLSSLLEGKTLTEYSENSKLSINTVKTQLKSIFSKTNTNKQSAAIALFNRMNIFND